MAKHIIFLVHGMGDTVPGWSSPVQKAITDAFAQYFDRPFGDDFAFKELNYNHVFQSHIDKWRENAEAVLNQLEVSGADSDLLDTLLGFSEDSANDAFASTHILDVILYRFMRGIKSQVIAHLSEQMVGKLNESAQVPPYSIICHSLGTAVMHDVLQANLTTDHFPLSTAHGVPRLYVTLANVSRVLEDSDTDVYRSAVRPELALANKPYACENFLSVAHELDPFTRVRPFEPGWRKGDPDPLNNLAFDAYRGIEISGLRGVNPHDLEHYLDNPACHIPLFRLLTNNKIMEDGEMTTLIKAYEKDTLEGKFDAARDAIKSIEVDDQASLDTAVKRWADFQAMIKKLKKED